MEGLNYVRMRGFLRRPKAGFTPTGYSKFSASLAVPVTYKKGGEEVSSLIYHNVSAWGDTAEALAELAEETPLEIEGHINSRSYDSPCKSCGAVEKKYWVEIQIGNFTIVFD